MNLITAPFRQLVERRLWPVAVLLVAALVAVPVLLKESDDSAATPATAATTAADGSQATLVTASDPGKEDDNPKVMGERKNPFQPAHIAKAAKTPGATAKDSASIAGSTGGASAGGSSSGSTDVPGSAGGSYGPVTPSTGTTTTPSTGTTTKPTYSMYSLEVAFGDPVGELAEREVKRLTGLPGGAAPAVIYIGLMPDHKTAVFVVDAGVAVQGDGACEPSPSQCQTLRMKGGDTVFLTRPGGKQYELDLVKVHTKQTTSRSAAEASKVTTARNGRDILRSQLSRVGAYRFSEATGTLKVLSPTAWKASVAQAAAAKR